MLRHGRDSTVLERCAPAALRGSRSRRGESRPRAALPRPSSRSPGPTHRPAAPRSTQDPPLAALRAPTSARRQPLVRHPPPPARASRSRRRRRSQLRKVYWPRGTADTHTQPTGTPARPAAPCPRRSRPGSGRQLVHLLLPTVGQVRLDDLGKKVPLQQGVGQGQQLGHRLVEVLQARGKTRVALKVHSTRVKSPSTNQPSPSSHCTSSSPSEARAGYYSSCSERWKSIFSSAQDDNSCQGMQESSLRLKSCHTAQFKGIMMYFRGIEVRAYLAFVTDPVHISPLCLPCEGEEV